MDIVWNMDQEYASLSVCRMWRQADTIRIVSTTVEMLMLKRSFRMIWIVKVRTIRSMHDRFPNASQFFVPNCSQYTLVRGYVETMTLTKR